MRRRIKVSACRLETAQLSREYSLECGAYVYLAIKIKKNGRILTFNSDSTGEWPLPEAQMVRHPLSERSLGH